MKFLILLLFIPIACNSQPTQAKKDLVINTEAKRPDTVSWTDPSGFITVYNDSSAYWKRKADSLLIKLRVSNYKIERIKTRIRICDKTPSQKKFFYGWVKRIVQ